MYENPKINQLRTLLYSCSYGNVEKIKSSCFDLFQYYPNLDPFTIPQIDGQYTKTLIELRGNVLIDYENKKYNIVTYITFPFAFPQVPPIIKLKNIDTKRFRVHPKYQQGVTPDGLFVYLYLNEAKNWVTHTNIILIMKEFQRELSSNFPFFEPVQNKSQNPVFLLNQNSRLIFNPNSNNLVQNINLNNPSQSPNNQQKYKNNGNDIMGNYGNIGNDDIKILNEKIQKEISEIVNKINVDMMTQLNSGERMIEYKLELEANEIQLNTIETDLKQKMKIFDMEIFKLEDFITKNDSLVLNDQNLDKFVRPGDPFSKQIIELVSESRALYDSCGFIEKSFKEEQIDLETVLKMTKKYSELEFDNKVLLKKCFDCLQK